MKGTSMGKPDFDKGSTTESSTNHLSADIQSPLPKQNRGYFYLEKTEKYKHAPVSQTKKEVFCCWEPPNPTTLRI